ncbi:MAG: phosphopantetheine-binding protein [Verrucomicrobiales bacterium]|nr:phosphopantetheine-binding protein [Verrucomicrobiales bacterium]
MGSQNDQSLNQLIADALGLPCEKISDDSSPDTLSEWDSITHLNLVMAVEEAYEVQLTPEDALDLNSVKLFRLYLEEKGKL